MLRIIDGRGTGKTKKLMEYAKENNALFVCGNPHAMEEKARAYGILGLKFMGYTEFLNNGRGYKEDFVVDEIELLVRYTSPFHNLIGYTLSEDD